MIYIIVQNDCITKKCRCQDAKCTQNRSMNQLKGNIRCGMMILSGEIIVIGIAYISTVIYRLMLCHGRMSWVMVV